jgi:hypothetical protein
MHKLVIPRHKALRRAPVWPRDRSQSARRSMSDGGQSAADIAAARVECGERVGDVWRGVDAECR